MTTETTLHATLSRRGFVAALGAFAAAPALSAAACPALLQHRLPRLQDERPIDLCEFAGRVLLVVNTASRCGYTGQYEGLEALHARYAARGFSVLGFPSNDFGEQEPGNNAQIADFCENTFGVRFPMFAKSTVRGSGALALYRVLAERSGESPQWNFHKYLISRDAREVLSFDSATEPQSRRLTKEIERLLARS